MLHLEKAFPMETVLDLIVEIRNAADMIDCTIYIFNEMGKEIWSGSEFIDDCIWDGTLHQ